MFNARSVEEIKREWMETAAGAGLSAETGGFLDHIYGPPALELWNLYNSLGATLPIAFVDDSSGEYIDLRAGEYGITRKPGAKARALLTLTGQAGLTVPQGTAFLTAEGLEFDLVEAVALAGGSGIGEAEAIQEGSGYNVDADTLTQMVVTLPGLTSWSNDPAQGGANQETDAALMGRLDAYRKTPATSGNVYHYEQWALEVPGVGAARITPLWDGPGTVKVLLAGPERGPVDEVVVDACTEHIEALRPIGAAVTVLSAVGLPIDVFATVTLDGSTTPETVRDTMADRLTEHLESIAFTGATLLYNRVAYILLGIDGVSDYAALTVNGGTSNVAIGPEQVPVLGEVTVA